MNCANCGSAEMVANVTPDMDIKPVPLCGICRMLLWAEPAEFERRSKSASREPPPRKRR